MTESAEDSSSRLFLAIADISESAALLAGHRGRLSLADLASLVGHRSLASLLPLSTTTQNAATEITADILVRLFVHIHQDTEAMHADVCRIHYVCNAR